MYFFPDLLVTAERMACKKLYKTLVDLAFGLAPLLLLVTGRESSHPTPVQVLLHYRHTCHTPLDVSPPYICLTRYALLMPKMTESTGNKSVLIA